MEIPELNTNEPSLYNKPIAIPEFKQTPVSAFLSLAGIIIPFIFWEDTLLVYVLMASPLFLVYSSRNLAFGLFLTAVLWPSVSERNLLMRILLIVDGIYVMLSAKRVVKYKMTATALKNNDFPLLI